MADKERAVTGSEGVVGPEQPVGCVVYAQKSDLVAVADAIREKRGEDGVPADETYYLNEMPSAIRGLKAGTGKTEELEIKPSEYLDALVIYGADEAAKTIEKVPKEDCIGFSSVKLTTPEVQVEKTYPLWVSESEFTSLVEELGDYEESDNCKYFPARRKSMGVRGELGVDKENNNVIVVGEPCVMSFEDPFVVTAERTVTPTDSPQEVVPDGVADVLSKVTVEAIPEKYKDTTDVTAIAENVLAGKYFVTADGLQEGTMQRNAPVADGRTLTAGNSYTIPKGYHEGTEVISAVPAAPQTTSSTISSSNFNYLFGYNPDFLKIQVYVESNTAIHEACVSLYGEGESPLPLYTAVWDPRYSDWTKFVITKPVDNGLNIKTYNSSGNLVTRTCSFTAYKFT